MKKIIFIIIFIILFLGIGQNVYAGKLLLEYPKMGDIELSEEPTLPEIIKYIYLFSLGIVGFVALISMLIGAIRYITSAGNASKAEDAKDQMTQAILGIIILLAAVLILRTINPDLVNIGFKLPETKQENGAIFKGCFINNECLNKCKPLCVTPQDAYCAIPLDTGTCPQGQSACYCQK